MNELSLAACYMPGDPKEIKIQNSDINRPGLQLSGFYDYYDNTRIQVFGKSEMAFVEDYTTEKQEECFDKLMSTLPPAVVVTRDLPVTDELLKTAKKYKIPLLTTGDGTSEFTAALISILSVELAPRITRHGVMVEVYGEGILIVGESGVGKSETAIELVKRGHRLIADDAVEIRRVSNRSLVGSSPENIRHFIELRGVGIINARRIFGMGAVKVTEKIDMVISLEIWDNEKVYDRMGIENEKIEILGIEVSKYTIPIKPGRNLAIIIEVAAMNNRQKKLGYNAAQELIQRLGLSDTFAGESVDISD